MRRTRPGGRTAQTRAAVFAAAEELLREKEPGAISMVEIAGRAGVAPTSLYRRWGDVRTLLTEVAVDGLMRDTPLPNTGSLRGDLSAWARNIAASLSNPQGPVFFRVYVGAVPRTGEEAAGRIQAMRGRIEEIAAMLERARARGETAPDVFEVTDHLLAPLYIRALFGAPASETIADELVDYVLDADRRGYGRNAGDG